MFKLRALRKAIAKNKIAMQFEDVTISLNGNIKNIEVVRD
jgi:hypothetical protein